MSPIVGFLHCLRFSGMINACLNVNARVIIIFFTYNAHQWQQSDRLVLAGQRGQRAVQGPGTAKPDAD